jgi:gliding motility-associated lipoprotein GldD
VSKNALWLLALVCLGAACNSTFVPKPRGYFAVPLPEKKYQTFQQAGYPYSFEYPVYASIEKDSLFFEQKAENDWWLNIQYPQFNATLHISYKQIGKNQFEQLVKDAYTLTQKHTSKANSIDDSLMLTPNGVRGIFFTVGGNVATENQFFLSDSVRHYVRGALYFDATPNQDSLQPITQFLVADVKHLINTFKWKQ